MEFGKDAACRLVLACICASTDVTFWVLQVINGEPETELQHHSCIYPNGEEYVGTFIIARFLPMGPANFGR